jgi:hypothetical protein
MRTIRVGLALAVTASALLAVPGTAQTDSQTILGPGLYVFQTRTRSASCGDDERTGYVSSFVAPIHGVPGSRTMRMQLLNSPYWSEWRITVNAQDAVIGESTMNGQRGPSAPRNQFEVRVDRDRFTGTGTRTYTRTAGGRTEQCSVTFDALLRRIDAI